MKIGSILRFVTPGRVGLTLCGGALVLAGALAPASSLTCMKVQPYSSVAMSVSATRARPTAGLVALPTLQLASQWVHSSTAQRVTTAELMIHVRDVDLAWL